MKKYTALVSKTVGSPQLKCSVCLDQDRVYALLPCSHAHYCEVCMKKCLDAKKCYMCNQEISGMMKVYL